MTSSNLARIQVVWCQRQQSEWKKNRSERLVHSGEVEQVLDQEEEIGMANWGNNVKYPGKCSLCWYTYYQSSFQVCTQPGDKELWKEVLQTKGGPKNLSLKIRSSLLGHLLSMHRGVTRNGHCNLKTKDGHLNTGGVSFQKGGQHGRGVSQHLQQEHWVPLDFTL